MYLHRTFCNVHTSFGFHYCSYRSTAVENNHLYLFIHRGDHR